MFLCVDLCLYLRVCLSVYVFAANIIAVILSSFTHISIWYTDTERKMNGKFHIDMRRVAADRRGCSSRYMCRKKANTLSLYVKSFSRWYELPWLAGWLAGLLYGWHENTLSRATLHATYTQRMYPSSVQAVSKRTGEHTQSTKRERESALCAHH